MPKPAVIHLHSFGFKNDGGPPADARVFDIRHLPNPYREPDLRPLDGRSPLVSAWFLSHDSVEDEFVKIYEYAQQWAHAFDGTGEHLHIYIGCTGGRHRSVAMAESITRALREWALDRNVGVEPPAHMHLL